jgi:hypothetical protein
MVTGCAVGIAAVDHNCTHCTLSRNQMRTTYQNRSRYDAIARKQGRTASCGRSQHASQVRFTAGLDTGTDCGKLETQRERAGRQQRTGSRQSGHRRRRGDFYYLVLGSES